MGEANYRNMSFFKTTWMLEEAIKRDTKAIFIPAEPWPEACSWSYNGGVQISVFVSRIEKSQPCQQKT